MINNDPTRISLITTGVYVYASAYIGLGIFSKKETVPTIKHLSNSIMGLGLIGTLLATYWLFKEAYSGISDTKQMILIVFNGIGTAQITTLFGLGGAWLLDQQRFFVLGVDIDGQG
jgi:hypothetical protein